jgi:hypothetical protein
MLAEVASVDVQERVDVPPDWMLAGVAERLTVGAAAPPPPPPLTVTVALSVAVPPAPVTVMV